MEIIGQIGNALIVHPLTSILVAIYQVLNSLGIPYALGFSIIGLTIVIRLILYPLMSSQLRASKKMQAVAPHISRIRHTHKGDSKRIQAETMKLYKEHGVNPFAGCLPALIQLPVLFGLYSVLIKIFNLKSADVIQEVNKLTYNFDFLKLKEAWDPTIFGISLGASPANLIRDFGILVFLVPLLTGLFQFIQSKMLYLPKPPEDKDKKKEQDFATAFQSQATYIFPLMIAFFAFSFPIGLSLYWNTFTIFGIIQQYKIQGLGGLEKNILWIRSKLT